MFLDIFNGDLPKQNIDCTGCEKNAILDQYLALSHKWYKIGPMLPWNANRKLYQMMSDLLPRFQGHAIIWHRISQKWYEVQTQLWCNTNRELHKSYSRMSFWMTLFDLVKYSLRQSTAWSVDNSWASCFYMFCLWYCIFICCEFINMCFISNDLTYHALCHWIPTSCNGTLL